MAWLKVIAVALVSLSLFCLSDGRKVKRQARPCPDDCVDKPMDISFIVDCSSSIRHQNFTMGLWFVQNFVNKFSISPDLVRVSMVTFSDQVFEEDAFNFDRYTNKVDLGRAIDELPYRLGRWTETGMAIRWFMDNQYSLVRPGVRHVLIVVTDGNSQEWEITKNEAASALSQGVEIFAIGVGRQVDYEELYNIASNGRHVFVVTDYASLDDIDNRLAFETCDVPNDPECSFDPVDLTFVIDSSVSIGKDNFSLELNFIKQFVEDFEINPSSVRVAAVMFGDKVYENDVISFESHTNKKDMLDSIMGLQWQHSQYTKTWEGIDYMVNVLGRNFRSHAAHVGIIITDGWSQEPTLTGEAASRARAAGIATIAVGVGKFGEDLDEVELEAIAGDRSRMLTVDDFNLLNTIRSQLITTTCIGVEMNLQAKGDQFQ